MKKFFLISAIFLSFFTLIVSHKVEACTAIQKPPEDLHEFIESTAFIGLVMIMDKEDYESGQKKSATLKPFMVYRASPDFELLNQFTVEFEDTWSSCDININEQYSYQEVVIFKDATGSYVMGDGLSTGGLGRHGWSKLRSQVRYVGKIEPYPVRKQKR